LTGREPGPEAFADAAEAAAAAVEAMEDSNYSADYRRDLVATVTRRALDQAA
jgi:carbon-monoxide dehydrogenase medium subunit